MQRSKNIFQKSIFFCLFIVLSIGNLIHAQDGSNQYESFNFTFQGSKNTTKENSAGKTFVIISGTMTNNETGETERVNIVAEADGTDSDSEASATEKAEDSFWQKVKNFLFGGKKKKGDGVMLDENGMGDYRPGGPMPKTGPWTMTFRLKNDEGMSASFRLNYRDARQADQSFERDFHRQTIKL